MTTEAQIEAVARKLHEQHATAMNVELSWQDSSDRGKAMYRDQAAEIMGGLGNTILPRLPNCGSHLAKDNTGKWHYINHAGMWQACPPPFAANNGDYIVRAVNAHDDMIKALQDVVNWFQASDDAGNARGGANIYKMCRAALAKAGGCAE